MAKSRKLFTPKYLSAVLFSRGKIYCRDLANIARYGPAAPRFAERIWVKAEACDRVMADGVTRQILKISKARDSSGVVIHRVWGEEQTIDPGSIPKVRFCIDHWVHGVPWKDTGAYENLTRSIKMRGEHDGCRNMADVIRRYEQLDDIFLEIKKAGRFKTMTEINPGTFRGSGEPLVHLGPGGHPVFEGEGGAIHRYAIAIILGLTFPAQIGCVHRSALPYLRRFRATPPRQPQR